MNREVLSQTIHECILSRRIIKIRDERGNEIEKVIPVHYYENHFITLVTLNGKTFFNFNNIKHIEVLDSFPKNKRLLDRDTKLPGNLSAEVFIDEFSMEGQLIDLSCSGMGVALKKNVPFAVLNGQRARIKVAGKTIDSRIVYYLNDAHRIGFSFDFKYGQALINTISTHKKNTKTF